MKTDNGRLIRVIYFVAVTLLELPIILALAAIAAPELGLPITLLLLAAAVFLNWAVLYGGADP